ncbi:SCO family protein [Benzoatithermus flavus]|uniref:SCO family protein n=1 Tax=Benzoatithermus flavus TaxID=3108223 RepID=A0ABU8XVH7_9PROT
MRPLRLAVPLLAALLLAAPARPQTLQDRAAVDPPLGAQVPTALPFRDETGRSVRLAALLGAVPVILAPVYYTCPNLCGVTLAALLAGLRDTPLAPGRDYRVVAVSIDPAEGPKDAAVAEEKALTQFPEARAAVRFLTGDAAPVADLMRAIGYRYRRDDAIDPFTHAAGAAVLAPDGRLARWLPGIGFEPQDLRLALVEAGEGRIGTLGDRLLLLCSHFDPLTGRYTGAVMSLVRGLGAGTALLLAGTLGGAFLRERRRSGRERGDG